MLRTASALAACALSVALGACGNDGGPGETSSSDSRRLSGDRSASTTEASASLTDGAEVARQSPAEAYAAWVNALARRDAAGACALQAPEFTIALRQEAILVDRAELGDPCTTFEAILWEDPTFGSEIVDISVTQVTEEDALLAVHLGPGEGTEQTVRMVYHRARWRVLSVEERAGADEAVPGDTDRWVDAWCDLDPSMTRKELVAAMGEPSGEYTVSDGGEPQLWWAQDQYDFRAYLDPVDGSVIELIGDYDALSDDDRALLPCPELRFGG